MNDHAFCPPETSRSSKHDRDKHQRSPSFVTKMKSDDAQKHGKHSEEGTLSRKTAKLYAEV